ncbi:uncharacterized protein LOC109609506 [Aethina tumida]|uniref:uncharacterized protein LOC109609506 n=1 Tax=Aethina tumida TaxID=116153 RepID=UPI0021488920|nr:uncharacterized protein LOC109609506 [Aethina tumida]
MYKLILLIAIISACRCDDTNVDASRGHHYYHHHHHALLYHGLQFLVFLTIKFKLIFFFSVVFLIFCIGGKINALLKYIAIKEKHTTVVAHSDHHPHAVYIQAPSYGYGFHDRRYTTIKGRSQDEIGFYENFDIFSRMIRQLNITDLAFNSMNITTTDCKRRFVCEAEYNAKHTVILQAGYDLLSDDIYKKYKPDKPAETLEECSKLFPNCDDYEKKTQ